jgi:group II intron reverse transcriptase/maturase
VGNVERAENCRETGCPGGGDRVEPEGNQEAQNIVSRGSMEESGAGSLLEKVLDRDNLNRAFKRVKSNGGSAGVDGMETTELLEYLKVNKEELLENLRSGKYKPKPVKRVEIPKAGGGVRLLGIPTVQDRMIQQALVQVLQPIFEPKFSDSSYGYRPGRKAQDAVKKSKQYYEEGYQVVVDIDLSKYFDTINHDLLMGYVRKEVKDRVVLELIKKYLKSGVMVNGIKEATERGSPQGGPLSPLLSNVYLNEFDKEMEARGHRHVRYADDIAIYVKSKRAGERVLGSCRRYLEKKLKLKMNEEKSRTDSPLKAKFLGFALHRVHKVGIRVHEKALQKLREKLKHLTRRNQGSSVKKVLEEVNRSLQGWLNYYALADMRKHMEGICEWLRRRIRMYIWKQWKRVRTRYRELQHHKIPQEQAWQWANTRKGHWRIAGSPILSRALPDKYLTSLGLMNFVERYEKLHLSY